MTVAPNTPKTSWTKDNGDTIELSVSLLVDELSNLFIDEDGDNLRDTISTDGNAPINEWENIDNPETAWKSSITTTITYNRVTNDSNRTIASGDVRISNVSNKDMSNISWDDETINKTSWSNSFEARITVSNRVTENSNLRVTVKGDTRISNHSNNKEKTTVWSEDEY